MRFHRPRRFDADPAAEHALRRALALDQGLAEVQCAQANFILYFEHAWLQAEPCFRRALALNPRWSQPHVQYGLFLAAAYRPDEASAQVDLALDLDPLSPYAHAVGAGVRFMNRAYPEAERLARHALNLQADYPYAFTVLVLTLTESGRVAEAIPLAERRVAFARMPLLIGLLGMLYGRAGRMDDLMRLERELEERRSRGEYITPSSWVALAIGRGDGTRLRRGLEECLSDHTPFAHLRATFGPSLDAWRTEAVIDALLQQLGDGVRPPDPITMHP